MSSDFTTETFGENVFDCKKMRKYLPRATYKAIICARENGIAPSKRDADIYAKALKKWAQKKGVTRFTHWFQPLNNFTAEKRDSLNSLNKEGEAIIKFGGKQLLRGEGDASSLPNGGMRDTFEARGITEWDYTAFAFVKDNCLCIPTTFCGAGGETLDKKTPLLNSGVALNKQALRILNALNMPAKYVKSVVGAEQEYFLIDKVLFDKRKDLVYIGRTLFGGMPPKGQEFDDHYFRPPSSAVANFMREVDLELWKLGIIVKTEHNEVAPCQYELAPCYTETNRACDQNQLVMETLKNVALRRGFACLLHEKPFDKINGSGKHNNWSLLTNDDRNLLEAGDTPQRNACFLLMLAAVVKAVDCYNELLISAITSASNDLRLGGYEAPPRILTIFLGEPLISAINASTEDGFIFGKDILAKDVYGADRNRTSPLAFCANKFEFRMVGSSATIADVNTVLNTVVAESLDCFANKLESSQNVWQTAKEIVKETFTEHSRVLYNGNGYSKQWLNEAKARGLKSLNSAEAINQLCSQKAVELFKKHNIFTEREIGARTEIKLNDYCNTINLESIVACEIYERQISPAVEKYAGELAQLAYFKQSVDLVVDEEKSKIETLVSIQINCKNSVAEIKNLLKAAENMSSLEKAQLFCESVRKTLRQLRQYVNELEHICPKSNWPLPTYGQLLFGEK